MPSSPRPAGPARSQAAGRDHRGRRRRSPGSVHRPPGRSARAAGRPLLRRGRLLLRRLRRRRWRAARFPGVAIEVRDRVVWVRSRYVCDGYAGPAGSLRPTPTAGPRSATSERSTARSSPSTAAPTPSSPAAPRSSSPMSRQHCAAPLRHRSRSTGRAPEVRPGRHRHRDRCGRPAAAGPVRTDPSAAQPPAAALAGHVDAPLTPAGKVDLGRLSTLQSALRGSRPSALPGRGPDALTARSSSRPDAPHRYRWPLTRHRHRGRPGRRRAAGRRRASRPLPAEVVLGNCMGPGGDIARVATLAAGLPTSTPR